MSRQSMANLPGPQRQQAWRTHLQSRQNQQRPNNQRSPAVANVARTSRNPPRRAPRNTSGGGSLPKCARDYLQDLYDPFTSPPSCLPISPSQPSQPTKVFARGTLATSETTGFGFAMMRPMPANDRTTVVVSLSNYASQVTPTFDDSLPHIGSEYLNNNSPFEDNQFNGTGASLTQEVSWRIVSMGLRVKYVGTELERGGQIVAMETPNHRSVEGLGTADLLRFDRASSSTVDRNWHAALYQPVRVSSGNYGEWTYTSSISPSGPATANNPFMLGVLINAATPTTSVTYLWEAFATYEFIGDIVRSKTIHSEEETFVKKIMATAGNMRSSDFDALYRGAISAFQLYSTASSRQQIGRASCRERV